MFENLFKRPHAVRRHTTYPLLEERLLYLRHLSDRHFSRNSLRMVAQYLLVITDHLDLPGHAGEVVTHAAIEAAAAHCRAPDMGVEISATLRPLRAPRKPTAAWCPGSAFAGR